MISPALSDALMAAVALVATGGALYFARAARRANTHRHIDRSTS